MGFKTRNPEKNSSYKENLQSKPRFYNCQKYTIKLVLRRGKGGGRFINRIENKIECFEKLMSSYSFKQIYYYSSRL